MGGGNGKKKTIYSCKIKKNKKCFFQRSAKNKINFKEYNSVFQVGVIWWESHGMINILLLFFFLHALPMNEQHQKVFYFPKNKIYGFSFTNVKFF